MKRLKVPAAEHSPSPYNTSSAFIRESDPRCLLMPVIVSDRDTSVGQLGDLHLLQLATRSPGDVSGLISTSIRSALDCPLNYARSYLTELLPFCVCRVVYLNSNLILIDDIAKLSATPLGGGAVLAAPEYCKANFTSYFTFAFWSNPSLSLTFADHHTCYFNTNSKVKPSRWLVINLRNVDWNLYLNTLFWNLNYWDSISTLVGEVENPKKTLPKALFYALILVVLGYFFSLLMGTGAVPLDCELWTNGYFSDIAKIIGGFWLRWWIQGAAAVSNMGMVVAEMSSDSFQLLGMAEQGMLPKFFASKRL
ncbi:hypothetical protein C1H46_039197 [Malus baccata]|uniref:Hexosyltransferase n=1 Tax=Malus baccata TaxID=106549 RepID=A0A540KM31_MALBA|nr:hypothetical protein C1H46_039197 [Malus baccata]